MTTQSINPRTTRLINSLKEKDKVKILFVCLGNICRSPAADGIMHAVANEGDASSHPALEIDSAGTGNWHTGDLPDKRMRIHAVRRGYDLIQRARQIKKSDFDDFDIIIPMDASNERTLRQLAPSAETVDRIIPMAEFIDRSMGFDHVPDPYYEGAEGFERVLDLLENGCRNLYDLLER